jgi:succinyl-CoA synthetase beta subunit
MRLYEWQGKELLARHGVTVPRGWRWSEETSAWPHIRPPAGGYAVKAQTLEGGRGQRGGIRFCADDAAAAQAARDLVGSSLGSEVVGSVLIEERIDVAQ